MLLGYGGLMLLLIGMLTGYMVLSSDVLYMDSVWVHALDIMIVIVDVFAYAISASVLIYGIYFFGAKALITLYSAYLCITVFHYVALLCIGWFVFPGTLPQTIQDLIRYLFEDVLLFVALDCLRMFLTGCITAKLLKNHENKRKEYNRTAVILEKDLKDVREGLFPFGKFISFKNPIQIGIIIASLVYWLTFFFQYVHIINLTLSKFEYVEGLGMVAVYLLLYAFMACMCYCIMAFILIGLDEKLQKGKDT